VSGLKGFEGTLDPSFTIKKSKQCKMDFLAAEEEENELSGTSL